MATINVSLRTDLKSNEHDEYPLMIRLYHQKVMYPFSFDFKVHPKFWNSDTQQIKRCKFYDDYGKLNHIINQKKQRAIDVMENQLDQDKDIDPDLLRNIISLDLKEEKRDPSVCIISFCDKVIQQFEKEDNYNTAKNYSNLHSKLKKFSDSDYLSYQDIDSYFIEEFFDWLKNTYEKRHGGIGLSHNSAVKQVEYLKAIYRRAQKRFRNIQKDDPFFYFEETQNETKVEYLNQDQFEQFQNLETDTRNSELVQDMFIFAVFACGMRFSDVFRLKWQQIDFENQVVKFIPYKTRRDKTGKMLNPIGEKGIEILDKYQEKNSDQEYVFDWCNSTNLEIDTDEGLHKLRHSCAVMTSRELKKLSKKLEKQVHFHMSRSTFANLVKESGMTTAEICEMFDHADIKITEKYLKKLTNTDNTNKRKKLSSAISGF